MGAPKLGVCKRGHLRTPENISKHRQCLLCKKVRDDEWKAAHKKESVGYAIAYHKTEKGKYSRKNYLLRKNGWSQDTVAEVLLKQNNCCALCGEAFTENDKPYADHKHVVPPIPRGLLHRSCNFAIGLLKDSPEMCELAAAYLRKF